MLWSFLYLVFCRLLQLLALRAHSPERKEVEILVLRHELAIARRQLARPQPSAADRALLAVLSRALPRGRWSAFSVSPKTLLRLAPPARLAAMDLRQRCAGAPAT